MSEKIICSHCHQQNDDDDIFCIYCGHKLASADMSVIALAIKNKAEDIKKSVASYNQNISSQKEVTNISFAEDIKKDSTPNKQANTSFNKLIPPKPPEIHIDYGNDYNTLRAWLIVVSVFLVAVIVGALVWYFTIYIPERNRNDYHGYNIPYVTQEPTPTKNTSSQTTLRGLTNQRLSTRSGPGTQYTETGSYNNLANKWVEIRSRAWDNRNEIWWVEVSIEGRWLWTGYQRFDSSTIPLDSIPINSNYSSYGNQTLTTTNNSSSASSVVGKTCRINDPGANIRSGPGIKFNKVGQAPQGHWYEILECKVGDTGKDWYKINIDGTICWLSSELVELDGNTSGTVNGKPISASVSGPFPIGEFCYTEDDGNNIRSGPGTEYSIVGVANARDGGFLIVDSKPGSTGKDWYQIQLKDGTYGWISSGIVIIDTGV